MDATSPPRDAARARAFRLFARGLTVDEVARVVGRTPRMVKYWRAEARAAALAVGRADGESGADD